MGATPAERAKEIANEYADSVVAPQLARAILSAIREARADECEACAGMCDAAAKASYADAAKLPVGTYRKERMMARAGALETTAAAIRSRKDAT